MFWEKPVIAWLNYNGVWPKVDKDHFSIEYNYFHHFFEIQIFECWLPGDGEPDRVINKMREFLGNSTLTWREGRKGETWRWDKDENGRAVSRPGVKFTIKAEDFS